jgi:hypothetical protein
MDEWINNIYESKRQQNIKVMKIHPHPPQKVVENTLKTDCLILNHGLIAHQLYDLSLTV